MLIDPKQLKKNVVFFDINSGTLFLKGGGKVIPALNDKNRGQEHILTEVKNWSVANKHISANVEVLLA